MNRNDKEFLVEKIRTQYTGTVHEDVDRLRELVSKVNRPPQSFRLRGILTGSV